LTKALIDSLVKHPLSPVKLSKPVERPALQIVSDIGRYPVSDTIPVL